MKKLPITDKQILQKHHKFVRDDDDEPANYRPNNDQYQELLAKKYYNKLYKEYAIVDLSMFEEGKVSVEIREGGYQRERGSDMCREEVR